MQVGQYLRKIWAALWPWSKGCRSEQDLQSMVDMIKVGVFKIDSNGRMLYCNSEMQRIIFGIPQQDNAATWGINIHPDDLPNVRETFARVASSPVGTTAEVEVRFLVPGRPQTWLQVMWQVITASTPSRPGLLIGTSRDITDETKSRLEMEKLALAVQKTNNVVVITNAQREIEWVNPAFEIIFGYAFAEVYGKSIRYILHEKNSPDITQRVVEGMEKGQSLRQELWVVNKFGIHMMLDVDMQPTSSGYIFIGTDITKQKNTENRLRESEDFLNSIIENLPIGFQIFDMEGFALRMNERQREILNLPSSNHDLGVYNIFDDPQLPGSLKDLFRRTYQGEIFMNLDYGLPRDNDHRYFNLNSFPVKNADGEVMAMAVLMYDITKRKTVENQVRESEQRFRLLAENIDHLLYLRNADKLLYYNPSFARIAGSRMNATLDYSELFYMLAPNQEDKIKVLKAEDPSAPLDETLQIQTEEGDTRWIWLRTVHIPPSDHTQEARFLGIGVDITSMKAAENQLLQAKAEAEEALKVKDNFLSVMSHEIRTPLNVINGMVHLLLHKSPREDQVEIIQALDLSSNSLLTLINDILDFSRIQSGRLEIEKIDFDLRKQAQQLHRIFSPRGEERGLILRLRIDDNVPAMVNGDPIRLGQILSNLYSNALKFTIQGSISLHISRTEMPNEIRFTLTDTGIGIAQENLESIFEPFRQATASIHRHYGGTGLGLSIVRNLVTMMNGTLEVKSKEGYGTAFTLSLPLPEVQSAASNTGNIFQQDYTLLKGMRLMYVEDVIPNQLFLKGLCQLWNVDLVLASDGLNCLELIKTHEVDAILMDIQMPGLDGIETTRRIRNEDNPKLKQVPIIAISASVSETSQERYHAAGMNGFISKPIQPQKLFEILAQLHNPNTPITKEKMEKVSFEAFEDVFRDSADDLNHFLVSLREEYINYLNEFLSAIQSSNQAAFSALRHKAASTLQFMGLNSFHQYLRQINHLATASTDEKESIKNHITQQIGVVLNSVDQRLN